MDITELLKFTVKNKASELHLYAESTPMIKIDNDLIPVNLPAFKQKTLHDMVCAIMNSAQHKEYERDLEVRFIYEISESAKFDVHAFNNSCRYGAVFTVKPVKTTSN